jgi:16S rRNA (uracil1498-N3)-methyltransferase
VSAPVFFVERAALVAGDRVVLDGAEGRHAAVVRRIGVGESVLLTDGVGLAVAGVVVVAEHDRLLVEVVSRTEHERPQPSVTVVQALPKGDRAELAVETLTEVGVDRIVPWAAARSVTQWRAERAAKSLDRWRTTAREAAKQSRRVWWPVVDELATTADVVELLGAGALGVVLHEGAGRSFAEVSAPTTGEVVVVVGPEGGIAPDELAAFEAVGALAARMGPTVLRTSTAGAVAAGVLLAGTSRWR